MKKCLKYQSRLAFIERYCNLHQAHIYKRFFYKSLLISQLFIDSFFLNPNEQRLIIAILGGSFMLHRSSFYTWHQMSLSSNVLKALILLAKIDRIQLAFSTSQFDKQFLDNCVKFCGALKKNKSLKAIDLSIRGCDTTIKVTNRVFADLLPNKVDRLKGCIGYMLAFKQHDIQCLTIWDNTLKKQDCSIINKVYLFRLKAKRIQFDSVNSLSLFDIASIGPLRLNCEIKELAIHVRFIVFCREYFQDEWDWIRKYGPKIESAFGFLKNMNPDLTFELMADAGHMYKVNNLSGVSNIITNVKWTLKQIVEKACSIGLKLRSLNLTLELAVVSNKFFEDYPLKISKKLYLKIGQNRQLETSYEYRGTQISFNLKCYKNREYRTNDPLFENRIQYSNQQNY